MEESLFRMTAAGLLLLVVIMMCLFIYGIVYKAARIYNWNGRRYCYMGSAAIHKKGGGFALYLSERMTDLSFTTLYRICPTRAFCMKNRYKDMFVYVGKDRGYLVVNTEPMQIEAPL